MDLLTVGSANYNAGEMDQQADAMNELMKEREQGRAERGVSKRELHKHYVDDLRREFNRASTKVCAPFFFFFLVWVCFGISSKRVFPLGSSLLEMYKKRPWWYINHRELFYFSCWCVYSPFLDAMVGRTRSQRGCVPFFECRGLAAQAARCVLLPSSSSSHTPHTLHPFFVMVIHGLLLW